jgi:hypothetical protein
MVGQSYGSSSPVFNTGSNERVPEDDLKKSCTDDWGREKKKNSSSPKSPHSQQAIIFINPSQIVAAPCLF